MSIPNLMKPATAILAIAALSLGMAGSLLAGAPGATKPGAQKSDWPCVQAKVIRLTSTQIWDGPPTEELKGWFDNEEARKLVPGLISRRVTMAEAAAAIKAYAAKFPAEKRNEALVQLFTGVLSNINDERASIISGIERFQSRQRGRAAELEREGSEIIKLKEKAAGDDKAKAELTKAQELFDWNVRIFQERNQTLPLACEIPVLIEQRAFELGREIRTHMKD
jgi:hypothetical protein